MRIPAEVVPPVTNLGKENDEVRRPEPVTIAASISNDLSTALPDQAPAERDQRRRQQREPAAVADGKQQPGGIERRQNDRRVKKQAVLLDTRSKRGRRQASGDAKINIKV